MSENTWEVVERSGDARSLLGYEHPLGRRVVRMARPSRPALVLGSSQPVGDVRGDRAAAAGVDVVRRRTGGGAVLVTPGALVWVDLAIPSGDPLWEADVGRSFWWLGRAWCKAIESLGVTGPLHVHLGPMVTSEWSPRVCFAGVGPGEVLWGGRKIVGLSQRRTSGACLFSSAALLRWEPIELLDLLAVDAADRKKGTESLASCAVGLGAAVGVGAVWSALLAYLPKAA